MVRHGALGASRVVGSSLALMALVPSALLALQVPFAFQKLVEEGDPRPSAGTFFLDEPRIRLDGGRVVFMAYEDPPFPNLRQGIYVAEPGQIRVVADETVAVPLGVGTFSHVRFPSISGRYVAFVGADHSTAFPPPGEQGVYLHDGESLSLVVRQSDPRPDSTFGYRSFGSVSNWGATVIFGATLADSFEEGLFIARSGSIEKLADADTPVPGGQDTFSGFGRAAIWETTYVFVGREGDALIRPRGIYMLRDGVLSVVADQRTQVPGTGQTFTSFNAFPSIYEGTIGFVGSYSNPRKQGLFVSRGGELSPVLQTGDPVPGLGGTFLSLYDPFPFGPEDPQFVGDLICFQAQHSVFGLGIFLWYRGQVTKVLALGDVLDGRPILRLRQDFDGESIAVWALGQDGPGSSKSAIYLAPLPSSIVGIPALAWPGKMALVLLLLLLGWYRLSGAAVRGVRWRSSS